MRAEEVTALRSAVSSVVTEMLPEYVKEPSAELCALVSVVIYQAVVAVVPTASLREVRQEIFKALDEGV